MNPKVDSATRNVQVEATLANPKHQLLPGMFANVKVDMGDKKSYLTLPQTAITYNPYGSTVFTLKPDDKGAKDDKGNPQWVAQQVFVTTGPTRGDQVADFDRPAGRPASGDQRTNQAEEWHAGGCRQYSFADQ